MENQRLMDVSTKLRRIAEVAREHRKVALDTLAHHIDVDFLREAYRRTRKDGAVGVDGQTAEAWAENLEDNLQDLLNRFKSGKYWAPPVRRVHIPKGDGSKTRPIGIPTFEDKVLQRAVAMVIEAVYEQDFQNCSYGFRPGRSAHQALQALWEGLTRMGGGWVIDMDISKFYDTLVHGHLREFLDQRIRDGVLRRTIDKWLKAGVLEEGRVTHPELGTPQGGVISPVLANIYLHEVLDEWFIEAVRPRMMEDGFMVRYADDAVVVCRSRHDAERIMRALHGRMMRFGLSLHPEKTRLVDFRMPRPGDGPKSATFDLLGFTHYWGRSRKGKCTVKRKTAGSRFRRTIKKIGDWCRENRHLPVREQHERLSEALRGHDAYYGITGNGRALSGLRNQVQRIWRKWLDRRSRKAHMTWVRFHELLSRFPLPGARVVHSVYGRQLRLVGIT